MFLLTSEIYVRWQRGRGCKNLAGKNCSNTRQSKFQSYVCPNLEHESYSNTELSKTQDKVMMGAVVLKHLQNLPCNAHELSEMELPPPPTTTSSSSSSPSSGLNTSSNGNNSALSTSRDCVTHEIGAAVFGESERAPNLVQL